MCVEGGGWDGGVAGGTSLPFSWGGKAWTSDQSRWKSKLLTDGIRTWIEVFQPLHGGFHLMVHADSCRDTQEGGLKSDQGGEADHL